MSLIEQVRERRRLPVPAVARAIRQAAGVSQAEVATHLGVNRVTVARWESGTRSPRGQRAQAYGDVLAQLAEVA